MANNVFDFNLAFRKILYLLNTLKKEGVEIVPVLRVNEFYRPGYHGQEQQVYAKNFLCLALIKNNGATIFYLESARFGPHSDLFFMKTQTEAVISNQIQKLTIEEFKNNLGPYLFVPIDPNEGDMRKHDMIEMRNLLFQAIETLYSFITSNKLAEIYNQGE